MSEVVINGISISIKDIIEIGGLFAAIIVAWKGVDEYRASVIVRRAEWLYRLYHEFYVEPNLKGIRNEVDSEEGRKKIDAILEKPENSLAEEENKTYIKFNDYLNFFEFMMYLRKTKALKEDDITDMFEYYLNSLAQLRSITDYLKREGYELLNQYIKDNFGKEQA